MIRPAGPLQTQWNRPAMAQAPAPSTEPNILGQFAGKVGTGLAKEHLAGPMAAADPTGGIASSAALELTPQLIGGWFKQGGPIGGGQTKEALKEARSLGALSQAEYLKAMAHAGYKNNGGPIGVQYKNIGGLTSGPLGMSDMLMAGKGKDVSKVTYKKKGGEVEDVVEIAYHAPLAAKPSSE